MIPKEKAKELYSKMYGETLIRAVIAEIEEDKQCAKQCAIIAVDEILKEYSVLQIETSFCYKQYLYWEQVKQEIEKL